LGASIVDFGFVFRINGANLKQNPCYIQITGVKDFDSPESNQFANRRHDRLFFL